MDFRRTGLYKYYSHIAWIHELQILVREYRCFSKEARSAFRKNDLPGGTMRDYLAAMHKHRVSFSEYMYKFEYWKLNEEQRNEFISCSEMQTIYRKMIPAYVRKLFFTKTSFLKEFSEYIYRDWLLVRDSDLATFSRMVRQHTCIAKPISGTRGHGIFRIPQLDSDEEIAQLYEKCKDENILLEECIRAHPDIEAFHPQSLNTIRVVTMSNQNDCIVFGALLRMGAGDSFIDNTHSGGVFASIDINTGIVDTDGIDSSGHHYEVHPDSKIPIRGFKIPSWDKVIETCKKASHTKPDILFAGWDVCVREDGRVEFIEGNHAPDFDGGMQAPKKIGVKRKVQRIVKDLTGIDALSLIPVFSKTFNRYNYFD